MSLLVDVLNDNLCVVLQLGIVVVRLDEDFGVVVQLGVVVM